jgi:hypothetical protein
VTNLTTIVFLCRLYLPEDGWITGRNMLVKILEIKIHHKIICWLFMHFIDIL